MTRARFLLPWALLAAGALALFLGWYGVSGTAVTAKQVPYLVSGGLVGVVLVVLAAALFAAQDIRQRLARFEDLESKVGLLTSLLLEPEPDVEAEGAVVAVPGGSSYHRPECTLVAGKTTALAVDPADRRDLRPCRVCDPVLGTTA